MSFLFYRRPAYVAGNTSPGLSAYFSGPASSGTSLATGSDAGRSSTSKPDSRDGSLEESETASSYRTIPGIPEALSLDNILNGGTCPPCTARDFLEYLTYVSHASENLRFFLWCRDYTKRFNEATTPDLALAPEWTEAQYQKASREIQQVHKAKKGSTNPDVELMWKKVLAENPEQWVGTAHEATAKEMALRDPFATPPGTAISSDEKTLTSPTSGTHLIAENASSTDGNKSQRDVAMSIFRKAGLQLPFTVQPFRDEINRVVATYLSPDSPLQLNISHREKDILLHALAVTTHPSAFKHVMIEVEKEIRRQLHPNFIRWSIRNGNKSRVIFARGLGVFTILGGIIMAIILTLSKLGRGWRALAAIPWVIGFATLLAAIKGMCVVLHGLHHRQLHPWEYFLPEQDEEGKVSMDSMDTLVSANSYEEAPWAKKYERKNIIRKIFDREVWIKEPALRQIQDKIFYQSLLVSILLSGILCAIFVPLPAGNHF